MVGQVELSNVQKISNRVEEMRKSKLLSNDNARLVSFFLTASEEDAGDALFVVNLMYSVVMMGGITEDYEPSQEITTLVEEILKLPGSTEAGGRWLSEEARTGATIVLDIFTFPGQEMADQATLLNRQICQGPDPLSILLATGVFKEFEAEIRQAHVEGPGFLTGRAKDVWLFLASCSTDESKAGLVSVRQRGLDFGEAVQMAQAGETNPEYFTSKVEEKLKEIQSLPFTTEEIGGVRMPVYASDLGFASAYWGGAACAAVRSGIVMVGCRAPYTLEGLGIKVSKVLSPTFGLIL